LDAKAGTNPKLKQSCSEAGLMPHEWKHISDLCHAALKLQENECAAFLPRCIAGDIVRHEVASLPANKHTGDNLLKSPRRRSRPE